MDTSKTKIKFNDFINSALDFNIEEIPEINLYCPILFALKINNDIGQKDPFLKKIHDQFVIDNELELTIDSFSKEIFNECLLFKLLSNA